LPTVLAFAIRYRGGCLSGKSLRILKSLSSPRAKNIVIPFFRNMWFALTILPCQEGRLAIVTNVGWDAVDAGGATDERACLRTAKPCGSGAPKQASSSQDANASRG
jgi:hypothetical protein